MIHQQRPPTNSRSVYASKAVSLLGFLVLLLLLAISGLIGFGGRNLLFPPTPTLTATPRALATRTPDFRATQIYEDRATQVAFLTSAPPGYTVVAPTPIALGAAPMTHTILFPVLPNSNGGNQVDPSPSPTMLINLPLVPGGSQPLTPESNSPLPTPTATLFNQSPIITVTVPVDTPVAPPTETPTPNLPTPTFTPTPSPTAFFVQSLNAEVTSGSAVELRVGPSTLYGKSGTVTNQQKVILVGRDPVGEWVMVYWESQPRWVRQANLVIKDNPIQPGAPPDFQPNDVRWLPIQPPVAPATPFAAPLGTPTPAPLTDFPHVLYNHYSNGRVASLPSAPLQIAWPIPGSVPQSAQRFVSPVIVLGNHVIAASADQHLYSYDRIGNNQRWIYNLSANAPFAPVAQDFMVYVMDEGGNITALNVGDYGVNVQWRKATGASPVGGLTLVGSRLYFIGTVDNQTYMLAKNRFTGDNELDSGPTAGVSKFFSIGDQLIYVSKPQLYALDLHTFETVWTRAEIANLPAPPAYALNGVIAFAELYVADGNKRIFALDANTGRLLWANPVILNEPITGIAVGDKAIYVASEGYVTAIDRKTAILQWRVGISGNVVGSPLVDGDQILIVTHLGAVLFLDMTTGAPNPISTMNVAPGGAPAISGSYIFIPGVDGNIQSLHETPR